MKRRYLAFIAPVICLGLMANESGCDGTPSSDQRMNAQQEQASNEAAMSVGFPAIRNYQEKRMMKQILELRDSAISTITYTQSVDGKLHFFCDSIGYGLPYATQFTSPQKDTYYGTSSSQHLAMPQADPNGLFSPASADGTWVLCHNPNKDAPPSKRLLPVYVEPHVIVSPFALTRE